jgi:hypothetical protein
MTNQEQESKWRSEFHNYVESDKSIYFYSVHESIMAAEKCYIAACKIRQKEIQALDLSVDAMTSGFCLLEKRHREFTHELEEEIQRLKDERDSWRAKYETIHLDFKVWDYLKSKEEIKKRDKLLKQASHHLSWYMEDMDNEMPLTESEIQIKQWLKEYGKLK